MRFSSCQVLVFGIEGCILWKVQEGVGSLDVDFCSIRIDSGNDDPLQQQLHHISMQRQELQRMEIELRAQVIVKSEILDVQNNYEAQLKEQSGVAAKLKVLYFFCCFNLWCLMIMRFSHL